MKQTSYLFFLFIIPSAFSFSQEICNNNMDDDGDRLIDLSELSSGDYRIRAIFEDQSVKEQIIVKN